MNTNFSTLYHELKYLCSILLAFSSFRMEVKITFFCVSIIFFEKIISYSWFTRFSLILTLCFIPTLSHSWKKICVRKTIYKSSFIWILKLRTFIKLVFACKKRLAQDFIAFFKSNTKHQIMKKFQELDVISEFWAWRVFYNTSWFFNINIFLESSRASHILQCTFFSFR